MLKVRILTPEGEVFSCEDATGVFLPGSVCPFEVLTGHDKMISSLVAGDVRCVFEDGTSKSIMIKSGFVEIKDNLVSVCAER